MGSLIQALAFGAGVILSNATVQPPVAKPPVSAPVQIAAAPALISPHDGRKVLCYTTTGGEWACEQSR